MMCNPFSRKIELTSAMSPADVADRLSECIRPVALRDDFETSLHARSTPVGFVSDGHFQIEEAMYGYGGARAVGSIELSTHGAVVHATLAPSAYMRHGFAALGLLYALVIYIFAASLFSDGLSAGRTAAFVVYSAVFAGLWALMRRDMGGLARLLTDVCESAPRNAACGGRGTGSPGATFP